MGQIERHKGVGEDESAVAAEKEFDDEVAEPVLPSERRRPPCIPVLFAHAGKDLVGSLDVFWNRIDLSQEFVAEFSSARRIEEGTPAARSLNQGDVRVLRRHR